ncbi:MAG: 2-dehydro-3-deoxy-D-gluconate 5-dehydrogenase KduD [Clostridiaceae bacterium]
MNTLFSLENKVAIVTGGNAGLGRAVAKALAEAGADIAVVSRGEADAVAREVAEAGRRFLHVRADLAQMDAVPIIVERVLAAFGEIDILVNNAGIIRREDSLAFTEQDWDDVMGVNAKALFFLSQAVANQMVKQGTGGKIINTASLLSFQGGIRVPAYTASKSAVKGMTMLMANEWAKYNIQVNAVAPGYMETDNTAALRADESRYREILSRIPAGRWGKPEDLAGTYVYLASDASNYVTGFTIAVDGGWLAR